MKLAVNLAESIAWKWRVAHEGIFVMPEELHSLPEQQHLRRLLHFLDIDCVFDIGANAGQYAQLLRKKADFSGRIISFEPIPELADAVRHLAKDDKLWNLQELALANATGERAFNVMVGNQFSSLGTPFEDETTRFAERNVTQRQITVQTETLTDAYRRLKEEFGFKRPFLKLDSQGFDVSILKSGETIASEFLGLQSELSVKRIYKESVNYLDAISYYEGLGFDLSAFVPNNGGHFPELIEMDCIMVRSDLMPNPRRAFGPVQTSST